MGLSRLLLSPVYRLSRAAFQNSLCATTGKRRLDSSNSFYNWKRGLMPSEEMTEMDGVVRSFVVLFEDEHLSTAVHPANLLGLATFTC